jgi:hypothetical protein
MNTINTPNEMLNVVNLLVISLAWLLLSAIQVTKDILTIDTESQS